MQLKLLIAIITLTLLSIMILGCPAPTPAPTTTPPAPTQGPGPTPVPTLGEVQEMKNVIQTDVQDTTVHYLRESFWSDNDFAAIVENKDEFTSCLIEEFTNIVSSYRKEAVNPEVTLNSQRKSVVLNCRVTGAISKTGNRYYATFEWLIRPLGLDFIDNNFIETEEGLFWEGDIDGTPTVIEARFPYTGSSYEAWSHPTGHCHAHVWWEF
jgi:hypothetical protein